MSRLPQSRRSMLVVLLAALLLVPSSAAADTRVWDRGANTDSWHNPINWSGDQLPTSADDVIIPGDFQPSVTAAAAASSITLGSPLTSANLTLIGATAALVVESGTTSVFNGSVTASGGGVLTLKGPSTWNSGTWSSGDSNGLFDIRGPMAIKTGAGSLSFAQWSNSAAITYEGTDVFDMSPSSFLNTGSVTTTSGQLGVNAPIAAGSSGAWTAGAGSTIAFSGTGALSGAAAMSGAGTMRFSSGTISIPSTGSYAVSGTTHFGSGFVSLGVNGSTGRFVGDGGGGRSGTGTLTVNGIVGQPSTTTTSSTNFSGGTTIVKNTANNPDLTVVGGINANNGGILTLEGETAWNGGNFSSATFNGGTIDNDGDVTIATGAGGTSFVDWTNSDSITYNGTDTLGFDGSGALENDGTVTTTAGVLSVGGVSGASTGDWVAGASSELQFTTNTNLTGGSDLSGAGTMTFISGSLHVPATGSYAVSGITKIAGGTLSLDVAGTTGRLIVDGGGGRAGEGTLTVSGVAGQPSQIVSSLFNVADGATIIADGPNATDLTIAANINPSDGGIFTSKGTSQWTDGTMGGTGTGRINNEGPMTIGTGADGSDFARWTNSGSITYAATDQMNLTPTLKNTGTIATSGAGGTLSLGAIETGSNGDWTVGAGSTLAFGGTANLAEGAEVSGPGTVTLGSPTVTSPSGTTFSPGKLVIDDFDSFVNGGTGSPGLLEMSNGTLSGSGTLTPSALTWSGGSMTGSGITVVPAGAPLALSGAKGLSRTLRVQRELDITSAIGTFSGNGELEASDGGTLDFVDDSGDIGGTIDVRARNGGTVIKSGGDPALDQTSLSTLQAEPGGTISIAVGRLNAGAAVLTGGTIDVGSAGILGSLVINQSGVLQGSGLVNSTVDNQLEGTVRGTLAITGSLTNNGTVAPGDSAGTITAAGYSGTGTLLMELVSASSFDRLAVTGTAALEDSTLVIQRPGGFVPLNSATFDVVTAGGTVSGPPTLSGNVISPEHQLVATVLNGQSPAPAGRLRLSSVTQDLTPPDTTITEGPAEGSTTSDSTPTFAFTASEDGATFACRIDGGAAAPCTSPLTLGALADGAHTFSVAAADAIGNADATPATRSFTVDTKPPPVVTPAPVVEAKPVPKPPPPASTPAALTPAVLTAVANDVVAALPSVRRCVSRRRLTIRLGSSRRAAVSSVEIRIAQKKPVVIRGRRLRAPVVLAGLPKGRFVVRLTIKLSNGQQTVITRRYRTCVPKGRRS